MGDLTQAQKVAILVRDGNGTLLTPTQFNASTDNAAVAIAQESGDQTEIDAVGAGPGTTTVSVTGIGDHAGQSGSALLTVDASPLSVTFGPPADQ